MKLFWITSLVLIFSLTTRSQQLDIAFVKNCLNFNEAELQTVLTNKNFRLIEKEHKNMGDKLINKTEYYSNKSEENQLEGNAETAIFVNKKRSKKSVFITFSKSVAFSNFNSLEVEIKKEFTKEPNVQSEKYDSTILKFSKDHTLCYLLKEEETYYLIISNYPLEESYFTEK